METGGGEPQKRLAKMKKRCVLIPADYNNMMSIISRVPRCLHSLKVAGFLLAVSTLDLAIEASF